MQKPASELPQSSQAPWAHKHTFGAHVCGTASLYPYMYPSVNELCDANEVMKPWVETVKKNAD